MINFRDEDIPRYCAGHGGTGAGPVREIGGRYGICREHDGNGGEKPDRDRRADQEAWSCRS